MHLEAGVGNGGCWALRWGDIKGEAGRQVVGKAGRCACCYAQRHCTGCIAAYLAGWPWWLAVCKLATPREAGAGQGGVLRGQPRNQSPTRQRMRCRRWRGPRQGRTLRCPCPGCRWPPGPQTPPAGRRGGGEGREAGWDRAERAQRGGHDGCAQLLYRCCSVLHAALRGCCLACCTGAVPPCAAVPSCGAVLCCAALWCAADLGGVDVELVGAAGHVEGVQQLVGLQGGEGGAGGRQAGR